MKSLILFVFFLVLFSCHQGIQRADPPEDLISEEQMIQVTKDLMLMEGHINLTYKDMNTFYKIMGSSSKAVYIKHGFTKEQYTRSFEYYAADQRKMTEIYSKILDDLTLEKGKVGEK